MTRNLLHSRLLAAVLGPGWAQASMPIALGPMPQQDCAGGVALTVAPVPLSVASGPAPHAPIAQPRAGPTYIPLNPPPIF